jgi:putative membrane protein
VDVPKKLQEMPRKLGDSADRRTELAADRTVLAAERTYAAWVRTGLAALASGVGAEKLLSGVIPEWGVRAIGSVLVLFSAFSFGAAVWREVFTRATPPEPSTHRIHWIVLVIVNGSLILVAIGALVSVTLGRTGG